VDLLSPAIVFDTTPLGNVQTRGVSHTMPLPSTLNKYIKAKEEEE
jgi:hypothetical protein